MQHLPCSMTKAGFVMRYSGIENILGDLKVTEDTLYVYDFIGIYLPRYSLKKFSMAAKGMMSFRS